MLIIVIKKLKPSRSAELHIYEYTYRLTPYDSWSCNRRHHQYALLVNIIFFFSVCKLGKQIQSAKFFL